MSSSNAPFGLRPVSHPSGVCRPYVLADGIVTGYTSNILNGQPVKLDTTGKLVAAGVGDAFVGPFDGVEYTDATGMRKVSNYWPANTPGSNITASFYRDPSITYEIQADGTVAQTKLGDQANFSNVTAGSTATGYSAATLGIATISATVSSQLSILDRAPYPDNAWGDAFTIVRVRISLPQDGTPSAPYGG